MFRLSKYLLVIGVPIILISIVLLTWMYRVMAFSDIKKQSESSNIILSQAMANVLWPQISGIVNEVNMAESVNNDETDEHENGIFNMVHVMLDEPISDIIAGTNVVRVKLFNLKGVTVYSSDQTYLGVGKGQGYVAIKNALHGQVTTHIDYKTSFRTHSGEILHDRFVLSSYLPLSNEISGKIEGILEIYSDVTPIFDQINTSQTKFAITLAIILFAIYIVVFFIVKRLDRSMYNNIELAVARDSEKNANQAKSRFLANMSHELRTPLNAIVGYSEILEENAQNRNDQRCVDDLARIQTAAHHLLHLINGVLDLSKIEAGQMTLYKEEANIFTVIDEVVNLVMPLINDKHNRFLLHVETDLKMISTDVTKLKQILFNLMSNAAKFTNNGLIEMRIQRHTDQILFIVSDSGIGMTENQLSVLFEAFVQADVSTTRRFGGTGLGLTISRQFSKMMGGFIKAESIIDVGSTFTLSLPIDMQSPQSVIQDEVDSSSV